MKTFFLIIIQSLVFLFLLFILLGITVFANVINLALSLIWRNDVILAMNKIFPNMIKFELMAILGYFVVPVALFYRKNNTNLLVEESVPSQVLPQWAYYWSDPNNGCWGDKYWRKDHHPTDYKEYLQMWTWLTVRNPASGYAMKNLGVYGETISKIETKGILLIATSNTGKVYTMVHSNCPRFHIGPSNMNVVKLNTVYYYPFEIVIQPWVCKNN